MTSREVQEVEHDLESQADQDRAREQWEVYMEETKAKAEEHTPPDVAARVYQQWEDWAMWDEMNNGGTRKRRLHVEVQFGGSSSSSSMARETVACPSEGWNGTQELQVCLRLEPVPLNVSRAAARLEPVPLNVSRAAARGAPEGSGDSNATTVRVPGPSSDDRDMPLQTVPEHMTR